MASAVNDSSRNNMRETEVIVIGNGPSGISLSFYLSGYRPYYNGKNLSNEYLTLKLHEKKETSLLNQDLEYLSEGLEGRSSNPVALLFDALHHPDADLGIREPSSLDWRKQDESSIPHVILGKGKPGGAWQKMDGTMQTLSRANWMELPTMPFQEWQAMQPRSTCDDINNERASVFDVKKYYHDFVEEKQLQDNFMDEYVVTSVQKVFKMRNAVDSESGEVIPCCKNVKQNHKYLWEVRGYKMTCDPDDYEGENPQREDFCFVAPFVVLACGTFDIPNRLGIPGEDFPCVAHSLKEVEEMLRDSSLEASETNHDSQEPILVVGAGLSAADTIIMCLNNNIPVIHSFRRKAHDPTIIFKKLPSVMYREYHHIHNLMKETEVNNLYQPLPESQLLEVMEDNKVLVKSKSGGINTFVTSMVSILIGSRPDLSFLPNDGRMLGLVPKWPIDSKHNPLDVDPYTYQSVHESGLFALGPLVGDNFVRFGIGGSMGIMNYLIRRKDNKCM